jgi:ornithine carbamoyltransferase
LRAAALAGLHLRVAFPPSYGPAPEDVVGAELLASSHGGSLHATTEPREAVADADAVYTSAWPQAAARDPALRAYRVDGKLMRHAGRRAVFMHCPPARRGPEVEAAVIGGPRSLAWKQVANKVHAEQAAIYALATGFAEAAA